MNAIETKTYRDNLIRDLLSHTLGQVEANAGGWAKDRLDAITECDWDLCESSETHRPFKFATYRARLERAGKGRDYRACG